LAMVDYVVLGNEQPAADANLTERFIDHVLERHRQESVTQVSNGEAAQR